jgi:hypothetical protein
MAANAAKPESGEYRPSGRTSKGSEAVAEWVPLGGVEITARLPKESGLLV